MYRHTMAGRKRDAGLGAFPTVSLAKARERAQRCRELVADGVDPVEKRRGERHKVLLASAKAMTFEQCAKAYISAHAAGWKPRHCEHWTRSLAANAYPIIGALPVSAIDTNLVLRVLEPIWVQKPEMASKTRQRLEAVLDWARVRGLREGREPVAVEGASRSLVAPEDQGRAG
jgi:hypothetical protein